MDISFRPAIPSDLPYIKNSWLESYRNGDGVRGIPNTFYFHYEELLLRKTLPRCSNAGGLLVAYEHQEGMEWADVIEADILGWICCEALKTGLLVHYVYVRGHDNRRNKKIAAKSGDFRGRGVASELLKRCQSDLGTKDQPVYYCYRTAACWETQRGRQALNDRDCVYLPYPKWNIPSTGCAQCGTPSWETGTPGNLKTVR